MRNRKYRGDRTAIIARVPDELVERVDTARAEVGASRVDYVWSVLARHFDMPGIDPLAHRLDDSPQLDLPTTAGTSPHRAA